MLQEQIAPVVRGYELREPIGEGGYGVVFRAYQPLVGRDVAIKIILPKYANHPDFIRRFESEAQLVARLEHPMHIKNKVKGSTCGIMVLRDILSAKGASHDDDTTG